MRTITIFRCPACNHRSTDHRTFGSDEKNPRVGPCSMGGCACKFDTAAVESHPEYQVEIPSFPDRWAAR